MNIQSLSIVVPTKQCWNHCPFCVSRMHKEQYCGPIISLEHLRDQDDVGRQYLNRLKFVRDCGCNTMMITGTAEPQQNMDFIIALLIHQANLDKPFYNIELQTTGSGLYYDDLRRLAHHGVTTMAYSINSFDDECNWSISNTPESLQDNTLAELINYTHTLGMNVRASINLTDEFSDFSAQDYFEWGHDMKVEQMTFRKIYTDGEGAEAEWVKAHEFPYSKFEEIQKYIVEHGTPITRLPFGFVQYSVNGISTVIDNNCMAKGVIEDMKYAILRPNGRLYSRWDDIGSLIF